VGAVQGFRLFGGTIGLGLRLDFRLGLGFRKMQHREDLVEQVADIVAVLGRDGDKVLNAELAKVLRRGIELRRIDFVDGQKERLAGAQQQAREVKVGRGQLSAAIDHHHNGLGLFERNAGLPEDLRRNQRFVIGHDATRIHQARRAAGPANLAVDAVARDARLVADNGAARLGEAVKERGFADVGAAHNGKGGHRGRAGRGAGQRLMNAVRRRL